MKPATAAAGVAAAALAVAAHAQTSQVLSSTTITSGLTRPCWAGGPPGDDTRLFVIEQRVGTAPSAVGRIRVINNLWTTPTVNPTPFLTSPTVATDTEQGLLGMAFHPNYAQNGYFWTYYTRSSDQYMVLARGHRATADTANPTLENVLVIPDFATNHNGGWMAFGPDGMLYLAIGDGGGGNDNTAPSGGTTGNAQDITDNLKGKILRLDVDGPDNTPGNADDDAFPADPDRLYTLPPDNPFVGTTGDDEIWLYGLRNPWRNCFDSLTGELWIGDVGQDAREEIDVIPPYASGLNLGWRCYEATRVTGLGGCSPLPTPVHMPLTEYANAPNAAFGPFNIAGCAITGGIVYRGNAMPCFRGRYIFSDYCTGDIFSFMRTSSGGLTEVLARRTELEPPGTPAINNVVSFATDTRGEAYIIDATGGEVFRILPNGYSGVLTDANANGIPDACEGAVCDSIDFNRDQLFPDTADIDSFLSVFSGGPCPSAFCGDIDFNNDSLFPDTADIDSLLSVFSGGPCL
ncbi:MAG: PQQ-dependent sugar dehydrogenase [Phycisphaerales bacterium]